MVRTLALLGVVAFLAAVEPAAANHRDHLLAPESVCSRQTDVGLSADEAEAVMWCMQNYARVQKRRPRLRPLASLEWSAKRKAADILGCSEFSHTACGRVPLHWVRRTRFARDCYRVKENIAYRWPAAGTLRLVMSGWLHSDAHRQILLMRHHRWLGTGMVQGPFLGYPDAAVWVSHFGRWC